MKSVRYLCFNFSVHIASLMCCCFHLSSSNTRLSMAVHRVGNTLLINELDIPKIISGASHVRKGSYLLIHNE